MKAIGPFYVWKSSNKGLISLDIGPEYSFNANFYTYTPSLDTFMKTLNNWFNFNTSLIDALLSQSSSTTEKSTWATLKALLPLMRDVSLFSYPSLSLFNSSWFDSYRMLFFFIMLSKTVLSKDASSPFFFYKTSSDFCTRDGWLLNLKFPN